MKLIRIFFALGYLFWGGMLFYALGELTLRNAWFDLFEIQTVIPREIEFIPQEKETTEIRYKFVYNGETYIGSRKVTNKIVEERLPIDKNKIEVSFNTTFPKTNFLNQLRLKARSGNIGIVISLIFLTFIGSIDLIANKDKWLKIYGLK